MNLAHPKALAAIMVAAGLVTAATMLPTATAVQPSARTAGCGKQAAPTGDYSLVSGGRRPGRVRRTPPRGVDDVKFTADLLDGLQAAYCVDTRAVYATGKSNGAGFTGILACVMADRFAAIAPVAGAFYQQGKRCAPSRPVPVLDIHGAGDTTIPYDGDGGRDLPSVQTWVSDWSVRDHCHPDPRAKQLGDDVLITTYKGCKADVVHVAVTDGGHSWPGSDAASGPGYVTQTFEAHELIGDFFTAHKLRS